MYITNLLLAICVTAIYVTAAALPTTSLSTRSPFIPASLQDEYIQLLKINEDYLIEKKNHERAERHKKRQDPDLEQKYPDHDKILPKSQKNYQPCVSGVTAMCYRLMDIRQVIPQVCRDCDIIPVMYEETQGVPPAKEEGIRFPPRQLERRDVETEMEADVEMEMNHDPNGKCHVRKELPKCQKKIKKGKFPLPAYCRDCRFTPDGRRLPKPCRVDPENYNKCEGIEELPDESEYDSD
ncbi:hypothetical protein D6D18_01764 [Aureobasidium pullulans]|nr:hypothetical protein D6D18_01764 [Aureobasidium pullulans]